MQAATLQGYRKVFFDYPDFAPCAVVVPDVKASVRGWLLSDLAPADLDAFDEFECIDRELYERVECRVDLESGQHECWLYAAGPAASQWLGADWDEDYFLASGRLDYLENLINGKFDPHTQQ